MRKIIDWFQTEKIRNVLMAIGMFAMLVLIYVYLLNADLSTAPEFIYNQF